MTERAFLTFVFVFVIFSALSAQSRIYAQTFIEDIYNDLPEDQNSRRPYAPKIREGEEEFAGDDGGDSEVTRNEGSKGTGNGNSGGSSSVLGDNQFSDDWFDAEIAEDIEEDEETEAYGPKRELALSGGYHALFAIPIDGSIGDLLHFENSSYFAPLGFFAEFDYLNLGIIKAGDGLGLKGSWSRFTDEQPKYSFKMEYFTLDAFYILNFFFKENLDIHAYAGGGIMFAKEPTFNYTSGFTPETYNWIYPQALIGCNLVRTFWEHFTVSAGLDFAFPFGLKVVFPNFTFELGCGWRFR